MPTLDAALEDRGKKRNLPQKVAGGGRHEEADPRDGRAAVASERRGCPVLGPARSVCWAHAASPHHARRASGEVARWSGKSLRCKSDRLEHSSLLSLPVAN